MSQFHVRTRLGCTPLTQSPQLYLEGTASQRAGGDVWCFPKGHFRLGNGGTNAEGHTAACVYPVIQI